MDNVTNYLIFNKKMKKEKITRQVDIFTTRKIINQ